MGKAIERRSRWIIPSLLSHCAAQRVNTGGHTHTHTVVRRKKKIEPEAFLTAAPGLSLFLTFKKKKKKEFWSERAWVEWVTPFSFFFLNQQGSRSLFYDYDYLPLRLYYTHADISSFFFFLLWGRQVQGQNLLKRNKRLVFSLFNGKIEAHLSIRPWGWLFGGNVSLFACVSVYSFFRKPFGVCVCLVWPHHITHREREKTWKERNIYKIEHANKSRTPGPRLSFSFLFWFSQWVIPAKSSYLSLLWLLFAFFFQRNSQSRTSFREFH